MSTANTGSIPSYRTAVRLSPHTDGTGGRTGHLKGTSATSENAITREKYLKELDSIRPFEVSPLTFFANDFEIPCDIRLKAVDKARTLSLMAFPGWDDIGQLAVLEKLDPYDVRAAKNELISLSTTTRARKRILEISSSVQGPRPADKVEILGDPGVGTVYFLKQVHPRDNGTSAQVAPEEISACQNLIWKNLKLLSPRYVAAEGWDRDESPSRFYAKREKNKQYLTAFPNGFQNVINKVQEEFLMGFTGDLCYGMENPHVPFISAEDPAIDKEQTSISDPVTSGKIRMAEKAISTRREEYVSDRIKEIFRRSPGSSVALIFGMAHQFKYWFEDINPMLISIACVDPDRYALNQAKLLSKCL